MAKTVVAHRSEHIPGDWTRWIHENLKRGVPPADLASILQQSSFSEEAAARAVYAGTETSSGEPTPRSATKPEDLLYIYDAINAIHPLFRRVERRSGVSADEFLRTYFCGNRPVVLLDMMGDWQALQLWTPEYLKTRYGDELVEITANRNADPEYELNLREHTSTVRLADYVDAMLGSGTTNDFYMTANNHVLERTAMKDLLNDIVMFPDFLEPSRAEGRVFFWFGPAGTITPLHYDLVNIFMAQVYGRKLVKLIPSYQLPLIYNSVGVFSDVDCEHPDYARFPLFERAAVTDVVLNPGEVLFLPVGWWHYVRALDISMTVTLDNFRFANDYLLT